ncbi:glycosyltransferase [Methylobacterium tarhaniae]|uniref:glycosyltransferase n=1 Tax=Methylobacterium tarhaniae TaxID=1187852 RepID=UPI000B2D1522|nr:glycosyltransferase [Methylobacterium tarhaniae]
MRVLVVANAHPDHSVGGAEIAAYNLFQFLAAAPAVEAAMFLARTALKSIAPGSISARRPGEFLWRQDIGDWFTFSSAYPRAISDQLRTLLFRHRPDVIFVHHYLHLGIEILREFRRTLPDCTIIMTLHEFGAICNRQGQMLKADSNRLCFSESPEDCHLCFPERSAEDFWLRRLYIQKHLGVVDSFVAPSHFLRERYVAWGLAPERIDVIENGQPGRDALAPPRRSRSRGERTVTVGFFGQINPYKGLDVLLAAATALDAAVWRGLVLEVHGANLDEQSSSFRVRIDALRERLPETARLHWGGPYERTELAGRMARVDCVVVPSIWWENSPMVIQEAFACGKPVICSGIGGMAEKVRDGIDGLHFEVGNPLALAERLTQLVAEPDLLSRLAEGIIAPPTYAESGAAYIALADRVAQVRRTATTIAALV